MQKKCSFFLFTAFLFTNSNAVTNIDHIITFFIKPYPFDQAQADRKSVEKLNQTIATPGKISYKIAHSQTPDWQAGIFVTYSGYLMISNSMGQITLPRFTQEPKLKILITEAIEPILMIGNTIHHWEITKNNPAQIYSLERKQDPETKLIYWDYQKTALPDNNIIPLNTIVILTKPKNIIVPLGITLTNDNQQWILPTLYAKKNINIIAPALSILKIRQFFGAITVIQKKDSEVYYSSQINTQ